MATHRVDAIVANVTAGIAALHEAVAETSDFILEPSQLLELQQGSMQLSQVLYLEMGAPDTELQADEREGKLASSLTPSDPGAADELGHLPRSGAAIED